MKVYENLLLAAKCALADLEGIMPEHEPSGDRTHPAWKTIEDLKNAIRQSDLQLKFGEAIKRFGSEVVQTVILIHVNSPSLENSQQILSDELLECYNFIYSDEK
jgi:hypothetical protein